MMGGWSRREFMGAAIAAGGAIAVGQGRASAQLSPGPSALEGIAGSALPWAGERIVDCHFHERPTNEAMIAHLDGAGVSSGFVLAVSDFSGRMAEINRGPRRRIPGWARGSILMADGAAAAPPVGPMRATTAIEAVSVLRAAVASGAHGFAETVGVVPVDGPELQRLYALAAELNVPVMMHFQEAAVPNLPRYGITGFSRIESMLRRYPRTRFVCHASDFWGHIDAQYSDGGAYPSGRVNRGGLADRLLADYPNMFGDMGAPSGLIQMARDPEFTSAFLTRHQDKLLFGSDCGCPDGNGGRTLARAQAQSGAPDPAVTSMQQRMAAQGGLAGKCIAREVLNIAWTGTERRVFRKLVWANARRVYRL